MKLNLIQDCYERSSFCTSSSNYFGKLDQIHYLHRLRTLECLVATPKEITILPRDGEVRLSSSSNQCPSGCIDSGKTPDNPLREFEYGVEETLTENGFAAFTKIFSSPEAKAGANQPLRENARLAPK